MCVCNASRVFIVLLCPSCPILSFSRLFVKVLTLFYDCQARYWGRFKEWATRNKQKKLELDGIRILNTLDYWAYCKIELSNVCVHRALRYRSFVFWQVDVNGAIPLCVPSKAKGRSHTVFCTTLHHLSLPRHFWFQGVIKRFQLAFHLTLDLNAPEA